jgi:hypothetical protein
MIGTVLLLAIFATCASAQTSGNDTDQKQSRDDFAKDVNKVGPQQPARSGFSPVYQSRAKTMERFSKALDAYRDAVTSQKPIDQPLKELKTSTQGVANFAKLPTRSKIPKPKYTPMPKAELTLETLKAAELLRDDFQGMYKILQNPILITRQDVQDYLGELAGEIDQLQLLISKLQSAK